MLRRYDRSGFLALRHDDTRGSRKFALFAPIRVKKNCATTTGVVSDPDYHTQMNCNAEERRRQINSFASSPIQYQYPIVKHSTHDQLVVPNRCHRRAGKRIAVVEIDLFHYGLLRVLQLNLKHL